MAVLHAKHQIFKNEKKNTNNVKRLFLFLRSVEEFRRPGRYAKGKEIYLLGERMKKQKNYNKKRWKYHWIIGKYIFLIKDMHQSLIWQLSGYSIITPMYHTFPIIQFSPFTPSTVERPDAVGQRVDGEGIARYRCDLEEENCLYLMMIYFYFYAIRPTVMSILGLSGERIQQRCVPGTRQWIGIVDGVEGTWRSLLAHQVFRGFDDDFVKSRCYLLPFDHIVGLYKFTFDNTVKLCPNK